MKLSPKFDQALACTAKVHRGQLRKGTSIPMTSHLLAVTAIMLEHGGTETKAIGALLHDAAEDAGGRRTLATIKRKFGTRMAAIVAGCSDTFETPKPAWLKRKTDYLHHLKTASASVQLVSAADKLHNLQSIAADYREIGEALWGRFGAPKAGTLWYYRELAGIYVRARLRSIEFKRLARRVNETMRAVHRAARVNPCARIRQVTRPTLRALRG